MSQLFSRVSACREEAILRAGAYQGSRSPVDAVHGCCVAPQPAAAAAPPPPAVAQGCCGQTAADIVDAASLLLSATTF